MQKIKKLEAPWRITFDTNPDICNLNCIMCDTHSIYNPKRSYARKNMNIDIVEKVVASVYTHLEEIIPSTMGEPLLYPDFPKLIEIAKKYNVKINLTTNGTFPFIGVEKWAKMLMPVVSDIKVSINGVNKDTAESIMIGIDFKKQIENIKTLIKYRDKVKVEGINNPTITFQVTFMKKNLYEIPKLLELAIKLRVDRFKGHHLWVTWEQLKEEDLRSNKELINKWNNIVDELFKIKEKYKSNIKLDNIFKIGDESNICNEDIICPFLGKEAWIDWDGTFNICCAPDNLRKQFGYFGNVIEDDFLSLWNSEKYNYFINNWENNPICRICNMKRPRSEVKYE